MPIGSVTGAVSEQQARQLHSKPQAATKTHATEGSAKAASVSEGHKLASSRATHPKSGMDQTSVPDKVTLSNSSNKTQADQPVTYSKPTYRSQAYNPAHDPAHKAESATGSEKKVEDGSKLKSFASGALGLDGTTAKEKDSDSYQVGQFFKAAATVGGMLALFI